MSDRIATNPFCTRFFQPGSIPFYFHPPMSLDSLVQTILESPHLRTAIVGPHGSGKSTLLSDVIQHPFVSPEKCSVHHIHFHAGEAYRHRWRVIHHAWNTLSQRNRPLPSEARILLVVDGWEQMDSVLQWFTCFRAKARGVRILVTSHSLPAGFQEIWRTHVDSDVEAHVLGHMLRNAGRLDTSLVTESHAWLQSRNRHGQNLRESLFDMYDWYRDQVDDKTASG